MNPCARNRCSWFRRHVLCFFTGCDEWNEVAARLHELSEARPEVRQAARDLVDELRKCGGL